MTRRAPRWWHGVDAEAEDPDSGRGREPWADRPLGAAALTTAQQAVLAGLDDQPDGPRLDGIVPDPEPDPDGDDGSSPDQPAVPRLRPGGRPGNGTGNAPGDQEEPRPYRRTRWMEPEQER